MSNCVAALNHGLKRLRVGFPLSLRLIREIHEVLLSKGRGSHAQPGEFRRSQSWIGGTREDEGWTAWMDFFLQGVRDTANQAARTASNIDKLFRTDKEKIEHFGRGAASGMLIYRHA